MNEFNNVCKSYEPIFSKKERTMKKAIIVFLIAAAIFFALTVIAVSGDSLDYIPGDVNGDEEINMLDALMLCQYYVDGCKYDPDGYGVTINENAGDVDGNGVLNMLDVLALCQYYVDGCQYNPDGYGVKLVPGKIHTVVKVTAKAPTCTTDGNIDYWYCITCEKYFSDAKQKNEISFEDTVIPALGHEWDDGVVTKEATTTETGIITYTCTVCGDTKTEEIPVIEPEYSVGLEFTSNGDGTCYVSGIGTCTDLDIIVPEISPDGDTVTAVGNGYVNFNYTGFYNCQNITSVVIPASVTSIGDGAFLYCSSLTSIEIPASVTSIGRDAFEDCNSLTSVTFAENSQLTSIGDEAFYYCRSLTSIEIPASVTSIGDSAFGGCSSLTSIEIPASITSIEEGAFSDCSSLTSITFAENSQLTSIERYAFGGCSSLTSIEIPASVTSIGYGAFAVCISLTSITFAENSQLTSIGESAFYGCSSLTSVAEIPNSVTNIGGYSFGDCTALEEIIFIGTETEWNAIEKGQCWDDNTGNYTLIFNPSEESEWTKLY